MRGTLLNPLQAISEDFLFSTKRLYVTPQEWEFWMWRVSAIMISVQGSITGSGKINDDKTLTGGMIFSFANPARVYNLTSPLTFATERNQALVRRAYTYDALEYAQASHDTPFDPEGENEAWNFNLAWCGNAGVDRNLPVLQSFWIGFFFGLNMSFIDFHNEGGDSNSVGATATFSNFPGTDPYNGGSGKIQITGYDPIRDAHYNHIVDGYWDGTAYTGALPPDTGSQGLTSATASLRIEPISYYPWRDSIGNALYDTATGAYA